jgi:hypothetical protein
MARKKRRPAKKAKAERKETPRINEERVLAKARRRRKLQLTWSFIILAVLMVSFLVYGLLPKPSPYDDFARCLTEAGAKLYGTDWCGNCQEQKRMFGIAFKHIDYENCDYTRICQENGIEGYPTWELADGERLVGMQPLAVLAERTGCAMEGIA